MVHREPRRAGPALANTVPATVALAVALGLTACGGAGDPQRPGTPDPAQPDPVLTTAQARSVLDSTRVPADGDYPGGRFDIGETIPGPAVQAGGRLASSSWDVYYILADGSVGAWGESVRIFDSTADARASADDLATFWICRGPRSPVDGIPTGPYDVMAATWCAQPAGGYRATLSAADGSVTANLTVSGDTEAVVTEGLTHVWASLSATTQAVATRVP